MGLARFDRIRHEKDEGGWWFEVRYGLGPRSDEFIAASSTVLGFARVHRFHRELLAAIASLPDADRNDAALSDANYANTVDAADDEHETVIDFGQWTERNFSTRAAGAIDDQVTGLPGFDPRSRVHLYLRYLAGHASRARRWA